MGQCQLCKKRVDIPFRCNYCGQLFCAEHRLPENHMCPNLPDRGWKSRRSMLRPSVSTHTRKIDSIKHQKVSSPKTRSIKKKIILLFLIVGIFISIIPIYTTYKNQKIEIINLNIESKEVFSGELLNIYVDVSKSSIPYLENILNALNDFVDYVEEMEIKIDGKSVIKDEINLRFNENMTYVYPLIEKEPGKHVISVGSLSEEFEVLRIAKFEGSNLEMVPDNPWIGENISVSLRIENIGGIRDNKTVFCYLDNKEIGKAKISLNPEQSTIVSFPFCGNITGLFNISLIWEAGKFNTTVEVIAPGEILLSRPSYYYGWAEKYVSTEYQIPENKDIEGLIFFLDQIEFPEYVKGEFDCSECSSLLEWLLEGAGFHTYIAQKSDLITSGHSWIQVEIEDRIVAIEATTLTKGWGHGGSIKPWGIVSMSDGTYRNLTYEYRYEYQMFLDWKEKYSSSSYVWNRNITFSEWKDEYTLSLPPLPQIGIPSKAQYYYSYLGYESPIPFVEENMRIFSTDEYDWWNVDPYANIFPFLEW